jgi:hypothetical protein
MKELILFVSAFGVVFALGFQSLNVNAGHYRAAFTTSLAIGAFNLFLYKLAPNVNSTTEIAAYLIGGPIGIVCAMLAHARLKRWLTRNDPVTSIQLPVQPPMWGGVNGGNVNGPR